MPKRFISTGELDTHVIVPLSKQVLNNLISEMGYGRIFEDRIYFRNEFLTDSVHGSDDGTAYLTADRVDCVISPVLNPTAVKWAPYQSNYRMGQGIYPYDFNSSPVFINLDANVAIREALIPCSIQLEVKFVLMSRSNAYDLLNRLYSKYAPGEMIIQNDLIFEYKVPDDITTLLFYLYKLLMPVDADQTAYLDEFVPWMKRFSANKMLLVYNRHIKERKEVVIRKNAFQLIGQIDLSLERPEPQKSNQSTLTYEIPLVLTFQFNRPSALLADFPVVCNNKLIDSMFLSLNDRDANPSHPLYINETAAAYKQSLKPQEDGTLTILKVPWYDDWQVPYREGLYALKYVPFISQAFTLDNETDPEAMTVIDLADGFDQYVLKDNVLEEIMALGTDALVPYGKYMIQVFTNDALIEPSTLILEGSVLSIPNRDIKRLYHLVITRRSVEDGTNQTKWIWLFDLITKRK